MLKGTRMIVITKRKIIRFSLGVGIVSLCVITAVASKNKAIDTFSEYKPIINSEFLIIDEKKASESKENKLLKRYFLLGDTEKQETVTEPPIKEQEQEALIAPEVKKIDKGMELSNQTDIDINPNDYVGEALPYKIDDNGPQILIMHTHTTEAYSKEKYAINSPDRDLDESNNIVAVGEAMLNVFDEKGIAAYHDKTVHDYPSYNGAYKRAESTIRGDLEAYSGVKVVLDVHRDGITKEDGTKVKLMTTLNGKNTAQAMIVVGTDSNLEHKNWRENFKLAAKIQAKAIEMYPTLMRPINLRKERFNEQLTSGSLIIEIGTNGNTLEEAKAGAECVADVIASVLKEGN